MPEVRDFLIASISDYSLSFTFSILIQGLPFGPPLLINLTMLNRDITMIGIHKSIAGFSIPKIKKN